MHEEVVHYKEFYKRKAYRNFFLSEFDIKNADSLLF